ncbi:MAG: helix-turn-helix domain-containing protein [Thermoleophilia bacterium]
MRADSRYETFPEPIYCPFFQRTLELIGKRWTAAILRCLFAGHNRFSDILAAVPGLSARLLIERLRELIDAGIVTTPEDGPRGYYYLTERGADLREALVALEEWNDRWTRRASDDSG